MRLLFVLPTKGGGGGAHSVAQEASELMRFGVDVDIAVNDLNATRFATTYADMPTVCRSVRAYSDAASLAALFEQVDIVICTIFTTVDLVLEALEHVNGAKPALAYYIQDYEPLFSPMDDPLRRQAYDSYSKLPNALLYAKTDWIREMVIRNHGVPVEKVQPSIDTEIYYPGLRNSDGIVRVSAMVRPPTPRRAPRRTMAALKQISALHGDRVSLNVFGCTDEDIVRGQLPFDFPYVQHGVLSRTEVGALFRESDVVMDLSDYQAFGRTGLEAMACGCFTILPKFGGTDEYGVDAENSRLVDTRSMEEITGAFSWYVSLSSEARRTIHGNAIKTSMRYSIRNAALSELALFQRCLAA